jgi:hypothetical protein
MLLYLRHSWRVLSVLLSGQKGVRNFEFGRAAQVEVREKDDVKNIKGLLHISKRHDF